MVINLQGSANPTLLLFEDIVCSKLTLFDMRNSAKVSSKQKLLLFNK